MLLNLLQERRSCRTFLPVSIERQKVDILAEALLRSPSSRGNNPWEFVLIDDRELLQQLGGVKPKGASFIGGAHLAVAIVADPEKCDVWIEDCSIAATILQLTATSLGLGSCWSQIRLREGDTGEPAENRVKEILGLPANFRVEALVGLGYPGEDHEPHAREDLLWSRIHRNSFSAA